MKLFFFLLLSLIVHILILANVNEYRIKTPDKQQIVYDVSIVDKAPEVIETEPEVMPEITPEPAPTLPAKHEMRQTYQGNGAAIAKAPVRAETHRPPTPMTIPKINLPQSSVQQNFSISIPKLNVGNMPQPGRQDAAKALSTQLNSQSAQYSKSVVDTSGAESIGNSSQQTSSQNFFVIKNLGGNRKLVSIPDKPVFSLTTGTNVRAAFKVDRDGNTYSILLLNRTDSKIERLAIDFIQKLKFNAVLSDQSEPAEIILYFRVK